MRFIPRVMFVATLCLFVASVLWGSWVNVATSAIQIATWAMLVLSED